MQTTIERPVTVTVAELEAKRIKLQADKQALEDQLRALKYHIHSTPDSYNGKPTFKILSEDGEATKWNSMTFGVEKAKWIVHEIENIRKFIADYPALLERVGK